MMKNKSNIDVDVIRSGRRGYAIPFICLFVGLFFIIDSFLNADNFKIKARGEIVSVSKDSTSLNIKGIEIPFYMRDDMDRTKIHIGDYAEMLYSIESPHYNNIEQLKINGNMIYKFSWWRNNKVHVWFALIGAILIPFTIKSRNKIIREDGFDVAGPIVRTLVKVYPEDDDDEPTDIDYKEYSSIINEVKSIEDEEAK